MLKFGVILNDLSPSQLNFNVINSANIFLKENSHLADFIIFQKNLTIPCLRPLCSVMGLIEAYDYDGTLIATNLQTAAQILRFPGPKKVFYSYDLDWLRTQRDWPVLRTVYQNPNLELWARSENHKNLLELTWNRPVKHIQPECLVEEIYTYLSQGKI